MPADVFRDNFSLNHAMLERKHNKSLVPIAKVLRKNMTESERNLWYRFLRQYPIRFQRQKVFGNYVLDFYCAKAKLVIELDGSNHYQEKAQQKDSVRTAFLENYGLTVVRIPNNAVYGNFNGVCEYIDNIVKSRI